MVYVKLDAYSAMFRGWTIDRILKKLFGDRFKALEIYKDLVLSSEKGYYQSRQGYADSFCFNSHGLRIEVPTRAYAMLADKGLIFEEELDTIRLEMKGEGLDFCRELGVDVDTCLNRIDFWEPFESLALASWNVTRFDIAFDFINEHGDFLDRFGSWYAQRIADGTLLSDTRLCCSASLKSGQSFSYRAGCSEHSLQIGKSPRFLRIYDKCKEQAKNGIFYQSDAPQKYLEDCGAIRSWIRFELEIRRDWCYKIMFQKPTEFDPSGLGSAMRHIEENFLVRDPIKKEVLPFFADLFDWSKTVVINPIFYFIQSDYVERHNNSVERGIQRELLDIEIFGIRDHLKRVLKRWRILCCDPANEGSYRQFDSYRINFANLCADLNYDRPISKINEFIDLCDTLGLVDEVFPDRAVFGI